MLNSHQILAGARTKGGIKTYVGAEYVGVPTAVVNGTDDGLTITGQVEFDGVVFSLGNFDASSLDNVFVNGNYILAAVPKYDEPADRAAAELAGLNYYVGQNAVGESIVHYFIPSAIEGQIAAAGGHNELAKRRAMGAATNLEIQLLNEYEDRLERLSDPRYTGQLLEPVGVKYVAKRIYAQDNRSKKDALVGLTNQQIELFIATQGYIAAERATYAWNSTYVTGNNGGVLAKIKRAFAYLDANDAAADVDGVEIRLDYKNGDTLSVPKDLDGDPITLGAGLTNYSSVVVFEYYQPTYMSRGHEGLKPGVFDLYEVGDSSALGRINPLYMARDFEVARVSAGRGMPLPALTKYAYPLPVAKFTKAAGPVISAVSVYTPGKLDLV
jgi:hypothetical protein